MKKKLVRNIIITIIIIGTIIAMVVSSYMKAKNAKAKVATISKVSIKKMVQTVSITGNIEAKYSIELLSESSKGFS